VVIVPIYRKDDERARVVEAADRLRRSLGEWERRGLGPIRVHVDAREGMKPGAKYYHWEMRGVPLRLEIGPRDLDANQCVLVRRDTRAKKTVSLDAAGEEIAELLHAMQADMLAAARERMDARTYRGVDSYDRFKEIVEAGGFVYAGWNGDPAVEARVKDETKATIRCIPDEEFRSAEAPARCLVTGEPAKHEVVWARAY
jgi:prolyl-tRNA synthetase